MSRQINAGDTKVTRDDTFGVDPRQIVVNLAGNARWKPLKHASVVKYAKSFLDKGQINPCTVRPIDLKRVQLSSGFHRHAAALLIVSGSAADGIASVPDFKLKVRVIDQNEEEAFITGVIENLHRNETSAIDDAFNYRKLKQYGKTDEQVRELYDCSQSWLDKLSSLLTLSADIQTAVHERRLPVAQAVELSGLSESARRQALQSAIIPADDKGARVVDASAVQATVTANTLAPGGKVDTRKLAEGIRAAKQEQGKRLSRTLSELRKFLAEYAEDETCNSHVQAICSALLSYTKGERQGRWTVQQIEEHAKGK